MKTLKAILLTVAAVIGFAVFATEYTWKGGTGNWTDASKWETPASGYPSSADAEVKFSGDANVTLDTGAQTDVAYINVCDYYRLLMPQARQSKSTGRAMAILPANRTGVLQLPTVRRLILPCRWQRWMVALTGMEPAS